jgi:hypothetical protein
MPEQNNLKEERFILAHGLKGFSPWSLGSIVSRSMCGETEHHGIQHMVEPSGSHPWRRAEKDQETRDKICPSRAYP